MRLKLLIISLLLISSAALKSQPQSWARINLAGYKPDGIKVAVWGAKEKASLSTFQVIDKATGKAVFKGKAGKAYGEYGPFKVTYRLDFSAFRKP